MTRTEKSYALHTEYGEKCRRNYQREKKEEKNNNVNARETHALNSQIEYPNINSSVRWILNKNQSEKNLNEPTEATQYQEQYAKI